jgi:hypothetical protein
MHFYLHKNFILAKSGCYTQKAPDVVIGIFLVNDTTTVVLFYSRASHSFISAAYVGKHNLPLALLKY